MARWRLIQQFLRDLRLAARVFARDRGFAGVVVLTLGLGLGANTAIFTVLYNTVLRPLPYPEADRLVRVQLLSTTDERGARAIGLSYPKFVDLVREGRSFESLAAYARQSFTLTGAGGADRVFGEVVSAGYFPLLGVTPAVGRAFLDEEDRTPGDTRRRIQRRGPGVLPGVQGASRLGPKLRRPRHRGGSTGRRGHGVRRTAVVRHEQPAGSSRHDDGEHRPRSSASSPTCVTNRSASNCPSRATST